MLDYCTSQSIIEIQGSEVEKILQLFAGTKLSIYLWLSSQPVQSVNITASQVCLYVCVCVCVCVCAHLAGILASY
jgi:hypothetical protein